jgi:EAL domain-containing protein (putative c-di-GMP-specific phosphodiesterase class I)
MTDTLDGPHAGGSMERTNEPPVNELVELLDEVLRFRAVHAVYQPLVELASGEPVGYEALARGPEGPLQRPDVLFATAAEAGRVAELDWLCRTAALEGALEAELPAGHWLGVNAEPVAALAPPPPYAQDVLARAQERLSPLIEVTERQLTAEPDKLLDEIRHIRRRGWGVALDDIGAEPDSLALLPLLRPDVIKLDLRLVQQQTDDDVAEIVHAVNHESQRSGAPVLAEGVESEAQLEAAGALGASLGQGWFYARPGPLPQPVPAASQATPRRSATAVADQGSSAPGEAAETTTPYQLVNDVHESRTVPKPLLMRICRYLEQQAENLGRHKVILCTFQEARFFTETIRRRYRALARDAALVGVLGTEMVDGDCPGVRSADLSAEDPLILEWDLVVLGPHFACMLAAVDLGHEGPDRERRFAFNLVYDRELVVHAGDTLMLRLGGYGD